LLPSLEANFSAEFLPASSASIHRYILSNLSKNGRNAIGR